MCEHLCLKSIVIFILYYIFLGENLEANASCCNNYESKLKYVFNLCIIFVAMSGISCIISHCSYQNTFCLITSLYMLSLSWALAGLFSLLYCVEEQICIAWAMISCLLKVVCVCGAIQFRTSIGGHITRAHTLRRPSANEFNVCHDTARRTVCLQLIVMSPRITAPIRLYILSISNTICSHISSQYTRKLS